MSNLKQEWAFSLFDRKGMKGWAKVRECEMCKRYWHDSKKCSASISCRLCQIFFRMVPKSARKG